MTTNAGATIGSNQFSQTAGESGLTLLQDVHLLLAKDADKTLKDTRGLTALGLAQQQANEAAVKLPQ